MYNLSRLKTAAAAAATVGVSSTLASAAVLAINFTGDTYSNPVGRNVTQTAFGVASGDWFNTVSNDGGTENTTISGVQFSWTYSNDWAQSGAFNTTGATGEDEVYYGYLDDGNAGAEITVTGLSAWLAANAQTGYNVTIIMSTGQGGSPSFLAPTLFNTSGGTNLGTFTIGNIEAAHSGGGVGIQGFGSINGLTNDTLFVDGSPRSGDARGSIAGIIITSVPEPSTMLLGGIGALALLRRRRTA